MAYDQFYSNTRVTTQANTSQDESTGIRYELTRVRHKFTQINTSPTEFNTNQHESDTSQHKSIDQDTIILYRSFIWLSIITV